MDRVLLPLDGSRRSERAITPAVALCRAFGSELVLLRVVRADQSHPLEHRLATAEARAYLRRILSTLHLTGIPTRSEVAVGDPALETRRLARSLGADLIVIECGCEDRAGCRLDCQVYSIASSTSASLLVVRDEEDRHDSSSDAAHPGDGSRGWPRRILVPIDGSPRGDWAACRATQIAESAGSEVILAHVVSPPDLLSPHRHPEGADLLSSLVDHTVGLATTHLERMRHRLEGGRHSMRARVTVARNVPREVDRMAREEGVDLIALSAHGWFPDEDWLHGSVTDALMTHGSTTLLIFQDWPRRSRRWTAEGSVRSRPRRLAELVLPPGRPRTPEPPEPQGSPDRSGRTRGK
jgi:nucleotide-binding universal stress UspA family protein